MSTTTVVVEIPTCDYCQLDPDLPRTRAIVDGKTNEGPWANMCPYHFAHNGVGLGTGKGQRYLLAGREHSPQAECADSCDGVRPSGYPCRCVCHFEGNGG